MSRGPSCDRRRRIARPPGLAPAHRPVRAPPPGADGAGVRALGPRDRPRSRQAAAPGHRPRQHPRQQAAARPAGAVVRAARLDGPARPRRRRDRGDRGLPRHDHHALQLPHDRRGPAHGQRPAHRDLDPPAEALAPVPRQAANRRPALPRDGGHLRDPGHRDERRAAADQRGADAHRDVRDHGALRLDAGLRRPGGEPAALPRDPLADHADPRPRHRGQGGGERALQPRGDRDRGGEAGAGLRPRGSGGPGLPGGQREEPGPVAPPLRDGDPVRAGGGVPAGRRHRGDRVARRAPGDERRPDHRRADRIPLLPARPLPAHPEPEPEPRRDQFGPRRPRARLLGGGRGARRQGRARRPDAAAPRRRDPLRERELRLRRRPAGAPRHRPAHQGGRARGHRGADRRGQEHPGRAGAALLRSPARARHHRRPRPATGAPGARSGGRSP